MRICFIFNRKRALSVTKLALVIIILLLFVHHNTAKNDSEKRPKRIYVGLAKHKLVKDKVMLVENSIVAAKENLNQYKDNFANVCDVELDEKIICK